MPVAFPTARDNHGSRNRSIAIAKLITKFHVEGDPITYVERFEQICAAFGDVSGMATRLEPLESNWMAKQVHGIERLRRKKRIRGIP